jgi:hypothetical protein
MTAELSDNEDDMQLDSGEAGSGDEDADINPRQGGKGQSGGRPPSANGQRRRKQRAQQGETYDDDENF